MTTQISTPVALGDTGTPGDHNDLVTDVATIIAVLDTLKTVPVRQTVLSGAVDGSGLPNALTYSGGNISIDAAPTPMVIAFANGFGNYGALDETGVISADVSNAWSGLPANATSYLYVERNPSTGALTYGSTLTAPVYDLSSAAPGTSWVSSYLTMTSANTPSPYVASASNDGAQAAYRAFDNDVTTEWQTSTGNSPPQWVQLDFGSGYQANQYRVAKNTGTGTGLPTAWELRGSNDNTNWTTLDTRSGQTLPGGGAFLTFTVTTPGVYRYYRLYVTAVNSGTYSNVSQLDFEGNGVGSHWFDLNTFVMKSWNGSAWEVKQRVFVGQADTNGSGNITSLVTYAYKARYNSGLFAVSANNAYVKNHNIGVTPTSIDLFAAKADNLLIPWDVVYNAAYLGGSIHSIGNKDLTLAVHSADALTATDTTAAITQARVVVSRGW